MGGRAHRVGVYAGRDGAGARRPEEQSVCDVALMNNHDLLYRPLISGVSITNERIGEPGTLGYIAKDALGGFWLVSAYHVLCNTDLSPSLGGESIYQPAAVAPEFRVATTRVTRANANLDCAAAQIAAGV